MRLTALTMILTLLTGCAVEEKLIGNMVSDNATSTKSQSDAEAVAESSEPIKSTREDIGLSVEILDLRKITIPYL